MRGYLWPKPRQGGRSGQQPNSLSLHLSPLHPLMRDLGRWVVVCQWVLPTRPKWVAWCGLPSYVRRDRAIGESSDWNMRGGCSICQQLAAPRISDTNPETENTTVLKFCVIVRSGSFDKGRTTKGVVCRGVIELVMAHRVRSCNHSD